MIHLKLFVFNNNDDEELVDFYLDENAIQGFYPDPDDDTVINLLSYGQLYTVKKTHALMHKLKYNEN